MSLFQYLLEDSVRCVIHCMSKFWERWVGGADKKWNTAIKPQNVGNIKYGCFVKSLPTTEN